ncbi:MAG: NAD(P)-dependent oxidoreductase [Magnetococcales bacterium]|nr:NAD(P)-dependent oxidoreductase [Magnetococcales bacterium]
MKNIGMIGLGIMGEPMARNIAKAGFNLSVWNRTANKAKLLCDEGANLYKDATSLAAQVDAIVIMVSGPEDLLEIIEQICLTPLRGKTVINVSTVSPEAAILAEKKVNQVGGQFLDAPVSGSKVPAINGGLVFLVGGEKEVMERCRRPLEAMGNKLVHCGPVGAGSKMKLAINLLLTNFMQGLAETVLFAQKMGLQTQDLIEVATNGAMAAPMVKLKGEAIASGDFSPHFPLRHLSKDMRLVLKEAALCDAELPIGSQLGDILNRAEAKGLGDEDICALYKALKD